jgi:hypothetical protein
VRRTHVEENIMRWIAIRARWLAAALAVCAAPGCVVADGVEAESPGLKVSSVEVFYDELAPYGEWIEIHGYGRVWQPSAAVVGADFVPYSTGGAWIYTDCGWTFETGWAWGWAPFHYGRWMFHAAYGWVWLPDTVWGPAWVEWRFGGGYVGWAPLPPMGVVLVEEHWIFIETRHFVRPDVRRYAVPRERVHVAFTATAPVTSVRVRSGVTWRLGPPVTHVTREARVEIHARRATPSPPGVVHVRPRVEVHSTRPRR